VQAKPYLNIYNNTSTNKLEPNKTQLVSDETQNIGRVLKVKTAST
jgi:hypothetical protein